MPKRALVLHFLVPLLGKRALVLPFLAPLLGKRALVLPFLDLTVFRCLQNVICRNTILNLVSSLFSPLLWFSMYTWMKQKKHRQKKRPTLYCQHAQHLHSGMHGCRGPFWFTRTRL